MSKARGPFPSSIRSCRAHRPLATSACHAKIVREARLEPRATLRRPTWARCPGGQNVPSAMPSPGIGPCGSGSNHCDSGWLRERQSRARPTAAPGPLRGARPLERHNDPRPGRRPDLADPGQHLLEHPGQFGARSPASARKAAAARADHNMPAGGRLRRVAGVLHSAVTGHGGHLRASPVLRRGAEVRRWTRSLPPHRRRQVIILLLIGARAAY